MGAGYYGIHKRRKQRGRLRPPIGTRPELRCGAGFLRYSGAVAVCMVLAATLLACGGAATDERAFEAEAGAQSEGASVGAVDARVQDVEGVGWTRGPGCSAASRTVICGQPCARLCALPSHAFRACFSR